MALSSLHWAVLNIQSTECPPLDGIPRSAANVCAGQTDRAGLLLGGAGEATTKPPSFVPGLTNPFAETGKLACQMDDDECDHGYCHALESRRLI